MGLPAMPAEANIPSNDLHPSGNLHPSSNLRFGILLAGHASEYVRKQYNGVASIFQQLLGDPNETWDIFSVIDSEFPCEEAIDSYHGFVITGSRHDAHGSEPWVLKLCDLIQLIFAKKKKLLGICFGHQVTCRALGGKTGRAVNGWECGLKTITIEEAMYAKPYSLHKLPRSLSIIEVHQDEIWELPPGGEVLASSPKTRAEMFAVGDDVLGIQGHPEFTEDITLDILNCCNYKSILPTEIINEATLSFKTGKADRQILKQICKAFLKDAGHSVHCC